MPKYLITQTRELVVEAPSAAVARAIAERGFQQKLSPADIRKGMSVSNIQNVSINVEKVK